MEGENMTLTAKQMEFVKIEEHTDNMRVACLASAGSGKSTVITNRVVHLVQDKNVSPDRIALFSFSRAATEEIKERLVAMLGQLTFLDLTISTIHSLSYKIVREHHDKIGYSKAFNIMSESQMIQSILTFLDDYEEFLLMDKSEKVGVARSIYDDFLQVYQGERSEDTLKGINLQIYNKVHRWMKSKNLITFAQLLFYGHNILRDYPEVRYYYQNKFDYIFLDEQQDSTKIMIQIIQLLLREDTRLFLAFDIMQTLYEFNGANPYYLMEFCNTENIEIRQLNETFRFGSEITQISQSVISRADIPEEFKLETETVQADNIVNFYKVSPSRQVAHIVSQVEKKIAEGVDINDINVLCRTNAPLTIVATELAKKGIKSRLRVGSIFKRKEVSLLLKVIRLHFTMDVKELADIVSEMRMSLDQKTLKSIEQEWKSNKIDELDGSVYGFLKYAIETDIKGIGTLRKQNLCAVYDMFLEAKDAIDNANEHYFLFESLFEIMNMETMKFVDRTGDEDSDPLFDIRNFVGILDSVRQEFMDLGIDEFENFLKIEFIHPPKELDDGAVNLRTIHSSKGLTLPYNFLMLDHFRLDEIDNSELFCLYVGLTRTKKELHVYSSQLEGSMFEFLLTKDYAEIEIVEEDEESILEKLEKSPYMKFNSALAEVEVPVQDVRRETAKAILVKLTNGSSDWLPKSKTYVSEGKVYIPRWLARKKKYCIS
jgi:DNA helicase-2/ATP-dependent DNA helicase PcrA